jgi:hypothetical protein
MERSVSLLVQLQISSFYSPTLNGSEVYCAFIRRLLHGEQGIHPNLKHYVSPLAKDWGFPASPWPPFRSSAIVPSGIRTSMTWWQIDSFPRLDQFYGNIS